MISKIFPNNLIHQLIFYYPFIIGPAIQGAHIHICAHNNMKSQVEETHIPGPSQNMILLEIDGQIKQQRKVPIYFGQILILKQPRMVLI